MSCVKLILISFPALLGYVNCFQNNDNRPNIVIIVGDDVGWNDVGFHGSNQIPTPNIDALAYNSMVLNRFYTQPTCTPSRSALLTGYYPIRYGMQGIPLGTTVNKTLPLNFKLLPEKLKELGYSTHLVGKWHLGFLNSSVTPLERGFDTHFGFWTGLMTYYDHMCSELNMTGFSLRDGKKAAFGYQGQYITDVFTHKAVNIINNYNSREPFFLFVSHLAAHSNGTITEPKNITETNKKFEYIKQEDRRMLAGAMADLDNSVGDIVEALQSNKILNNTIVILFMDNGAEIFGYYPNGGSNWPLRGQKYTTFEGGVRGSAIFYSSQIYQRSVINNELMHITDIFPTLYAAAGGDVTNLGNLDGVNQWDVLTKNFTTNRKEILLNIDEENNTSSIIGLGLYKLVNGTFNINNLDFDGYHGPTGREKNNPRYRIRKIMKSKVNKAFKSLYGRGVTRRIITKIRSKLNLESFATKNSTVNCKELCLFNIEKDPLEANNIKDVYPEIVESLTKIMNTFWKELVPQPTISFDYNANPSHCNNSWFPWKDSSFDDYCS